MFIHRSMYVDRKEDYKVVRSILSYMYSDAGTELGFLADLQIYTDWKTRLKRWGVHTRYKVQEFEPVPSTIGRAFFLWRHNDDIASDPHSPPRYSILIDAMNLNRDSCDCRGFYMSGKTGHPCKHVYAMRALVESRRLEPQACEVCGLTDCELTNKICKACEFTNLLKGE